MIRNIDHNVMQNAKAITDRVTAFDRTSLELK